MAENVQRKLHVAIFTNNYLPNPYGVSASIESFRKKLVAMGHIVYVFAPQWKHHNMVHVEDHNVFRYPSIDVHTKVDFSLVVPYAPKIDAIIRNLPIDIVHTQHPNLLGAVGKKWAHKMHVPLVFTWHTLYDHYVHYLPFMPQKMSGKIAVRNAVTYAEACDRVIVPTETIHRAVRAYGVAHDRIDVIPSGVDEELFAEPDGSRLRACYGFDKKHIVLVTVSRLTEEKNVLFLARCVARVLRDNGHVRFLCVGEGDLASEMEHIFVHAGVRDQVVFAGMAVRCDVKGYLAAGDIFVYASKSETQGTIVTENMYSGRPIVAVGINGVNDLVEHGVNGLATAEDGHAFIHAMQIMIDDRAMREFMGSNAARIAREKYTATACTQKLITVYEKAIDGYYSM